MSFWTSPRAAILATFFAFGIYVGIHVGALPALLERGKVSPEWFGIYQFGNMLTALLGMWLAGLLNRWLGHRTVILIMLPLLMVLIAGALFVESGLQFGVSLLVLGFAYAFLDLFMNAEATYVEEAEARPLFGQFHGCVGFAMAIAGLLSGIASRWYSPWAMIPVLVLAMTGAFVLVWRNVHDRPPVSRRRDENFVALPRKKLALMAAAMGLGNVCEMAAIAWSGSMLTFMKPEWAAYSGLGIAFYGLCTGIMRFVSDPLRARIGDYALMRNSLSVAVVGFMVLALSSIFWISVLAFAAIGAGLSMVFPCLFSAAGRMVPEARAAAMGFAATVMSPPRIIMPLILGWLAGQAGFSAVFAACGLCAAICLAIIVLALKDQLIKERQSRTDALQG